MHSTIDEARSAACVVLNVRGSVSSSSCRPSRLPLPCHLVFSLWSLSYVGLSKVIDLIDETDSAGLGYAEALSGEAVGDTTAAIEATPSGGSGSLESEVNLPALPFCSASCDDAFARLVAGADDSLVQRSDRSDRPSFNHQ